MSLAGSKDELKKLRRAAADLNRDGSWGSEAIELNSMLLQLDPEDGAAYCRRGKCHRQRGDLDKAAADYGSALERSSEGASVTSLIREEIADIEKEAAEKAEAERAEREQREVVERARRAELQRQREAIDGLRDCDEAVAVARDAKTEPQPDTDFALAAYRRAVELDTGRLDVAVEWAAALRESGHHGQATRIYERVLELHPDHRAARVGKAAILVDAEEADQALRMCNQLLSEYPDDSFARKVKARAHAARGEMTEAVWHYENAADL